MIAQMTGHAMEIAIGPPLFSACPYVVKHPASTEMIENEIARLENRSSRGPTPACTQARETLLVNPGVSGCRGHKSLPPLVRPSLPAGRVV